VTDNLVPISLYPSSTEAAVDTNVPAPRDEAPGSKAEHNASGVPKALYNDAQDALKAVRDDYLYWTGKLTETSVQLSYAVLGANWAVFGSVDKILTNSWSKFSVLLVIVSLALNVLGAKVIAEKHLDRINYAEANPVRWSGEFATTAGKRDPWPFTSAIESLAGAMRTGKTWLPLIAGVLFVMALIN
jgi:hypothetical protein